MSSPPMNDISPAAGRRRRKARVLPPPRHKATVKDLALEGTLHPDDASDSNIDTRVIERIRKCLDRGNHANTPEAEARAALRMANKIMTEHGISQADVLNRAKTSEDKAQLGGQSTVSITAVRPDGVAVNQTWASDVAYAMELFFHCKSYSTALLRSIDWTFYGIAANTVAAAMAFEMAHNLVMEWSRSKTTGKNSYCLGVADGLKDLARKEKSEEVKRAKEREKAETEKKIQEEHAARERELDRLNDPPHATVVEDETEQDKIKQEEHAARERELDRLNDPPHATVVEDETEQDKIKQEDPLASPPVSAPELPDTFHDDEDFQGFSDDDFDNAGGFAGDSTYESMDSDSEDEEQPTFKLEDEKPINLDADLEAELQEMVRSQPQPPVEDGDPDTPSIKQEPREVDEEENKAATEDSAGAVAWASHASLVLYRKSAQAVAEEYLKARDVRLRKGSARERIIRDFDAFDDGVQDSRKIDVKRRRIDERAFNGSAD